MCGSLLNDEQTVCMDCEIDKKIREYEMQIEMQSFVEADYVFKYEC